MAIEVTATWLAARRPRMYRERRAVSWPPAPSHNNLKESLSKMHVSIPFLAKVGGAATALVLAGAVAAPTVASASTAPTKPAATATAPAAKPDTHKKEQRADRRQIREAYITASAQALNMDRKDLVARLKAGASLSDLAAERHLTKDQFRDLVVSDIRPLLDKLVDSKKITRAQADHTIDQLQKGHLPLWERHHKK